jgi:methionyl-tRNA synthetase
VKTDRERAGTVLHHALQAIAGVNVALSPFVPFATASVTEALGQAGEDAVGTDRWIREAVPAGRPLGALAPLFAKLDPPLFGDPT